MFWIYEILKNTDRARKITAVQVLRIFNVQGSIFGYRFPITGLHRLSILTPNSNWRWNLFGICKKKFFLQKFLLIFRKKRHLLTPTFRHGKIKFSFHGVIMLRLNETILAGTLLFGGTVTTFVFSPSPTLVDAVSQNWYVAPSWSRWVSCISASGPNTLLWTPSSRPPSSTDI